MSRSALHAHRHVRRRSTSVLAAIVVLATLAGPASADHGASYVREWNAFALSAIFNQVAAPPPPAVAGDPPGAFQPPYVGALHMAMVQGAVYDAVNSITRTHRPLNEATGSAASGSSIDAAIVTAAYEILSAQTVRLPQPTLTWLQAEHVESIAEIDAATTDAALAGGVAAGHAAANAMLTARSTDQRFPAPQVPHREGEDPGEWRRTSAVTDGAAWVGNVTPFSLLSPAQLRTEGPLDLSSPEYAVEYEEVKTLGALNDSTRTQAQTDLATFFVPNPVEMFNRTLRTISQAKGLSTAEETRLLARVNVAAADALISCWNDKSFWSFWRPITAIHNGDDDENDATDGDTTWAPMLGTPPYPDHPSGYNCATAAMMHAAADHFGTDRVQFQVTRNAIGTSPVRNYARFTDVVDDTINSRIYLGFHFRTPDVQGAWIGKKAAQWLDGHELQRLR